MLSKHIFSVDSLIGKNISNKSEYYEFINIYEKQIEKIRKIIILHEKEIDKFFKSEISFIKKLNIFPNQYIESEKKYINIVVSVIIVKAFTDFTTYAHHLKSDDLDKFDSNFLTFESDKIINQIYNNIRHFIIWAELSFNTNENNKICYIEKHRKLRLGIYKILIILTENNILEKNTIWSKKRSLLFFTINLNTEAFMSLNIFNEKFKIYKRSESEVYIYIDHFWNMFNFLKENVDSGAVAKINLESKFAENLLEVKAMIDFDLLNEFFEIKLKKLKYKKENLKIMYEEIIRLIKQSIKIKDEFSYKEFSKKLSEISDLLRLDIIIKNKKEETFYYFPSNICFRGRIYFISNISFTFYKEFRYCLYWGSYENFTMPYHPMNEKTKEILSSYIYKIKKIKKYDFENKPILVKEAILWILISIAELKKNTQKESVHMEELIDLAINLLEKDVYEIFDKIDDIFKYKSLIKILDEINRNIYKKRIISKDATASCFQHLVKTLGGKEESSFEWCNLQSNAVWYDTYKIILRLWKESIYPKLTKEEIEIIEKYFRRNTVKKPIMTIQYGAKFKKCWEYFIEDNYQIEDEKKLIELFKIFYKFINEKIGLLSTNPKEIINALKKSNYIVILEDYSELDLNYYQNQKHQIKFEYKTKRYSKQDRIINKKKPNKRKLLTASRANYIHIQDAAIVRYVISKYPLLTIHDCFLIDYMSVTYLISLVNEAMQKEFHNLNISNKKETKIFSIFIII